DPISLRSFYDGNFFGLLNPIGVMSGLLSVCMVVFHGATYLNRRTEGDVRKTAKKLVFSVGIVFLILLTVAGSLIVFYTRGYTLLSVGPSPELNILHNDVVRSAGGWFQSYFIYPWKFFGPALAYAGIFMALFATYFNWRNFAFWGSAFAIGGCIATAGFTLFPFIMPSSTNPAESLTIWNAVSSQYALNTMLYVGVVLLLIILGYKIFAYHSIWGQKPTLSEEDVEKNKHTFY
ncbi:unnamed protein product, partial [marine sediment metagenome]